MPQTSRLHLGAAYYPEHWPEDRWPVDIRLMREAGLTVVRLAKFAWSTLEPSPGQFNLDWLERVMALLAEANIAVVLGAPTAAPPAWLATPAVLAVDEHGQPAQFGNRGHYCVNSPDFQAAAQRIVEALAARFGPNSQVIGWQLDNEYNRTCYCDRCRARFQHYLQQKFDTLDQLNQRWATAHWSQTYFDWTQIPLPVGSHHPGLKLEFNRFVSQSYRQFQQLQIEALRPHLRPGVWLAHNFMGWIDGVDAYSLSADLDLAGWDWHTGQEYRNYLSSGAVYDLTRGFKRRNFWLMETRPGLHGRGEATGSLSLHKGEASAMAWHAVAHGAEAVLYRQWRAALGGQEQYHGGLVDQAGQPRPFYTEVRQLSSQFAKVSKLLAGSKIKAEVAMLNSYHNLWAIQGQPHHQDFDYVAHFNHYYHPLAAHNITTDIISADASLTGYKLVIAPALHLLNTERADRLAEFARQGGHVVLTIRSGMKDDFNALLPMRQPKLPALKWRNTTHWRNPRQFTAPGLPALPKSGPSGSRCWIGLASKCWPGLG